MHPLVHADHLGCLQVVRSNAGLVKAAAAAAIAQEAALYMQVTNAQVGGLWTTS
jgi:hypothetical protein